MQVKTLVTIRHQHIVKLLCCYTKRNSNLLAHEYMPNGSLRDLLNSTKPATLTWNMHYRIAVGAAMVRSRNIVNPKFQQDSYHLTSKIFH